MVQNLAALPDDWAAAFDVAVLCRALWSLDYEKAWCVVVLGFMSSYKWVRNRVKGSIGFKA